MVFKELQVEITSSSDVEFLDSRRTSTPAWLIRLACTAHAGAASLAECRDLCEWFGVERRGATIQHRYQEYAAYHNQDFTVEPDRIAVDKKQIQLENEEKAWLYAAIDVDTKVVLHVQISQHRGRDPAEQFLSELKEKHRVYATVALATSRNLERQVDTVSQSVPITTEIISKTGTRGTQTRYQSHVLKSTMCYARAIFSN